MKNWLKFFFAGFFSHKTAKEGARRGYTNAFLSFLLALIFLWTAFIGGDMLPFGAHYNSSPDFKDTVHAVLANADPAKRIVAKVENGVLKLKKQGGKYAEALLVNTLENDADKQNYSVNGYNAIIDTRSADTLAEIEAYCISNDGKNTVISYQDYLGLSDVARLNFDFKIKYTGKALELNDKTVEDYRAYVEGLGEESKSKAEKLADDLAEGKITRSEYNRGIYELYFVSYYPEITAYERSSKVPLLRNYYQHKYIASGIKNYLFIFDDYLTGSFEAGAGNSVSFFGFYDTLDNGVLITEETSQIQAEKLADRFIKNSFKSIFPLNAYAYTMNVISLAPFLALMLMVAVLLTYSILKLRSVDSISSLGAMLKIVGSFVWQSGSISAVLTIILMFFVNRSLITALPPVLFFVSLAIRSVIFAIMESKLYIKQSEQQKAEKTED